MTDSKDIHADRGSVAAGTISDSVIKIINQYNSKLSKADISQIEAHYLKRLMDDCASLEWLRLVRKQDEQADSLGLDTVYTALMTVPSAPEGRLSGSDQSDDPVHFREEKTAEQVAVLDVLNQPESRKLVLTGDPGSGKSAFINYLALCLTGERLGDASANLTVLTEPLPDDEGNPQSMRQRWDHGALIPLRIILRDFSASVYFPGERDSADVGHLMDFLAADLKTKDCSEYLEILKARMRSGEVLVMFDGLDEVPQAGERRQRLLACIEGFVRSYADCRILVTCRPYAYQDKQWQLPGFKQVRLAAFGQGQIIHFIRRWYSNLTELDTATAENRVEKLQRAILSRESLLELAKRPLLLSLISYLHGYRHELPDQRADLYKRLLELLIDEWDKARFKTEDADAARVREQYSLAEYLQIGQDNIRLVLERLAFKAHASQDAQQRGTADIAAKDLIFELSEAARETGKQPDPYVLRDYLRDRVGVLYQRGGETERDAIYTFPHRSFQEYLAAAYFRRAEDYLFDFFEKTNFKALSQLIVENDL